VAGTVCPGRGNHRCEFTRVVSVLAQLEKYKYDMQLKLANGIEEFNKIMVERRKAYNEYLALKSEVKNT